MRAGRAAVVIGLMLLPAAGFAQSKPAPPKATIHATKGVVTLVDPGRLVIARSRRNRREMTFVLTPATDRAGNVTIGCTIGVRYRTEGDEKIATAVSVERPVGQR